jgi:hypothetical protein
VRHTHTHTFALSVCGFHCPPCIPLRAPYGAYGSPIPAPPLLTLCWCVWERVVRPTGPGWL